MLLIDRISAEPFQRHAFTLPDGSTVQMLIEFKELQDGWFIRELTYDTFALYGMRICVSPNLLNQYVNKLPFGLACFSKDNREPTQIQDFSSGDAKLFFLTEAEKEEYLELLSGQV